MIPVWLFFILMAVIGYLLYITRTTDDDLVMMSKNQWKRMQYWVKEKPD